MARGTTKALGAALLAVTAVGGGVLAQPGVAQAKGSSAMTLAVFGDAPYGTSNSDTAEFGETPAFIDLINADPDVSSVVHVGDIHSGKQFCTEAYDRSVADLWTRFDDSLVYTPGDNEWADCHKPAEGGGQYNTTTQQVDYVRDANGNLVDYAGGDPVSNLDLVRSVFFPAPGATLGNGNLVVESQSQWFDPAHPEDAAYVENTRWQRKGIQFVTLNIPGGSNNDADPWYKTPTASTRQTAEAAARTAADLRWLQAAFDHARADKARGVVVITQADMWDVDGKSAAHLTGYEPFVKSLADNTNALGGTPVLLLNGDSHVFRSDNPFSTSAPCTTEDASNHDVPCDPAQMATETGTHPDYAVPSFHRITVHGSTFPLEWLKLSVSTSNDGTFGPFSWARQTTNLSS